MKRTPSILGVLAIVTILIVQSSCQSKEEIFRQQYVVEGMMLYEKHCENCHQKDGSGLKDLYPPLAKTDLGERLNASQIACIIKNGQKDAILVNKKAFQNYMPGNNKLEALDVAELVTYLRDKWGNDPRIFSLDSARIALKNCP